MFFIASSESVPGSSGGSLLSYERFPEEHQVLQDCIANPSLYDPRKIFTDPPYYADP